MTTPAIAVIPLQLDDVRLVSDELIGRLCSASESIILDLLDRFSPEERANLAMFCYQKAHLHQMGLLIAATCELSVLVQTLGTTVGQSLYTRSREHAPQPSRLLGQNRSKISLTKFSEAGRSGFEFAQFDSDELVDENDRG
jgi:hypothetical protein